ncbi:hypothetical protein [Aliarcobacter butzleri]|uniref:hypothetical protein n=1 Tax=Aliarcobacter butzleri TaxID=28197 RepID=UPI000F46C411|nr:hypothetical protein [Aliarcobacter butzleri]
MQKAKTLDDIYNNFEGNRPLNENEYSFFVDIYDKKLKRFIGNIKRNTNYQNIFFIAGQRGNGKSTILNNLKHKNSDFETSYEIRHLQAKDLLNYNDVDIVDVLLIIGFDLIDNNILGEEERKKLEDEFKEKLQELESLNNGELEQVQSNTKNESENLNASVDVSAKAGFLSFFTAKSTLSGTYKTDENIRKEAKKIYKFKTKDLLNMINSLIKKYKLLSNTGKEILLIIDGLEKLNDIDEIFTEDISILRDIECYKIITMPVYLKETVDVNDVKAIDFTMEVDENGKIKNQNLLKDIILNRIENTSLITDEAINLAVEKSGGNLRQLLNIIQTASTEAMDIFETDKIGIDEIKSAIEVLKGQLASRTQMYSKFLNKIKNTHMIDTSSDKEELTIALQSGLVFAYFNGRVYYDINPIIEENLV